jgi:cell division protein FtsW
VVALHYFFFVKILIDSPDIVFQAFTHILVCVGYFPATGETLPMISRGGMSILTMSLCFGILLNISEEAKEDKKVKNKEKELES